jgi:hypothetical protein
MPASVKLILGACAVAILGLLVGVLLFLPVLILGPPVLFLVLAYAVVRALRDLRQQPALRTPMNVSVALLGLISLLLGGWLWYWSMFQQGNAAL